MPSWKKVIVSGSDASLSSLNVTNGVTGSLFGTSSYSNNTDLLDGKDSSTFATTGSNTFIGNQTVTGSLFTSGSNTLVGSTTLTGSLNVSGSTTQTGNNTLLGTTTLSGSIFMSGSISASANILLGGHLRLDPGQDPGSNNLTSSYLFTSASNTQTGFDLYYRQQNNLIKFKWLEGGVSTGLLYGGNISYSGSTIFIKPGSGIINNNNASTGSEISPIFTYVNWGPYTASATYLTSSQNTYLYVDASGSIFQQTSFFNQTQYEQAIPLGRVTHPNFLSITGVGSNVQTTYDSDTQQNDFIRAFGPIKVSGFSINAHTGSLGLGIGDGIAYNLGGFYTQDPNSPSHYESNGFATASIARAWRSGSGVYLDNNGGSFYNAVDPDYWDDGTGTLNTMNAGDWQIQRVFANPVTGRVVVYYGQNIYTNLLNALQYLATDSFTEGEFTAKSLVFVGYLVLKGQTNNLTDTTNNRIINAGIFRNIAGGSAGGSAVAQRLENLADVIVTSPTQYQALVYDGGNWINGIPASASFASTASSADNFTVRGTLTAQTIVAQTITSSTDFVTGSTRFGSSLSNTHQFTGSVSITGSLNVVGAGITGSLFGTASWANNATTASFVSGVVYTTGSQTIDGLKTFTDNTSYNKHVLLEGSGSDNYMVAWKQRTAVGSALLNPGNGYTGMGAFDNYRLQFYFNQGGISFKSFAFNIGNVALGDTVGLNIPATGGTLLVSSLLTGSVATASLAFTSSYTLNAVSASYALTSTSASYALTSTSASYAQFANTASSADNFTVRGTLTAQTLVVQTITSSVIFSSGSNRFGNDLSNTQTFTGSLLVTGSNHTLFGNVGLGDSSPTDMLVVNGRARINGTNRLAFGNSSGGYAQIGVSGATTGNLIFLNFDGSTTNENMRITTDGKVGIGTTAPVYKLEVNNSTGDNHIAAIGTAPSIQFASSNTGPISWGTIGMATTTNNFINGAIAGDLAIVNRGSVSGSILFGMGSTSNSEKMRITPAGSVGIGTTSPATTLHVSGTVSIGATSVSSEGNLFLGPKSTTEGGQIFFQAGTSYTSASMLDIYQSDANPYFRILRGTNTASDALVAQFNLHTKQFFLPAYTSTSSFAGTATAYLAVNSSGDVITVAGSGGGSVSGGSTNYIARWASSTSLTTGSLFDSASRIGINNTTPSYSLDVTGDIRATGAVYANANGTMYFRGGDDAELWDINVANTIGIYGQQDQGVASIKLGSGGGIISGRSGSIGIGTTSPTRTFQVNGYISSFDGTTNTEIINGGGVGYFGTSTNHPLALQTNNTERLRITSGGNVGIGTTSPLQKLDVSGSINVRSAAPTVLFDRNGAYTWRLINGDGSTFPISTFNIANNGSTAIATFLNNGNVGIGTTSPAQKLDVIGKIRATDDLILAQANPVIEFDNGSTGALRFYSLSGSIERMRVQSNGNVGIGTSSPAQQLHLTGYILLENNQIIRWKNSSGSERNIFVLDNSNNLQVGGSISNVRFLTNDSSERMRIDSGGNVGIGTTSPSYKLEVVGGTVNSQIARFVTADYPDHSIGLGVDAQGSEWAASIFQDDVKRFTIEANGGILVGSSYQGSNAPTNGAAIQGNVGIGTTTPAATLDINGDLELKNAYYNAYSSSVSGTTTLATIPTSSYNGVFFDFVAFSGSNQRAGTLIGNWRSGNVQYTEYSSPDIGSTAAALTMSVALSGANALVQSVSAPGWAIKATYRTV